MTSGTVVDSTVAITVSLAITSPSALVLPIANVALSDHTLLPISVHPDGVFTVSPSSFAVQETDSWSIVIGFVSSVRLMLYFPSSSDGVTLIMEYLGALYERPFITFADDAALATLLTEANDAVLISAFVD